MPALSIAVAVAAASLHQALAYNNGADITNQECSFKIARSMSSAEVAKFGIEMGAEPQEDGKFRIFFRATGEVSEIPGMFCYGENQEPVDDEEVRPLGPFGSFSELEGTGLEASADSLCEGKAIVHTDDSEKSVEDISFVFDPEDQPLEGSVGLRCVFVKGDQQWDKVLTPLGEGGEAQEEQAAEEGPGIETQIPDDIADPLNPDEDIGDPDANGLLSPEKLAGVDQWVPLTPEGEAFQIGVDAVISPAGAIGAVGPPGVDRSVEDELDDELADEFGAAEDNEVDEDAALDDLEDELDELDDAEDAEEDDDDSGEEEEDESFIDDLSDSESDEGKEFDEESDEDADVADPFEEENDAEEGLGEFLISEGEQEGDVVEDKSIDDDEDEDTAEIPADQEAEGQFQQLAALAETGPADRPILSACALGLLLLSMTLM